jgi:HEAT repeat protein
MTNPNAIEQAFRDLQHSDPAIRADAIKMLGEAAYAPAVPHLTELVRDSDPGTRYLAAMALSRIGDEAESAVAVLLIALRADDMYLRVAVTSALINIGEPAAPGLIKALFDQSAAVRRAAAKALGKIGSPSAVNALRVAAKDGDKGVCKFALEALERIESAS